MPTLLRPTHPAAPGTPGKAFALLLLLLCAVYSFWLLAFWPGVLGMDSLAILREVENPAAVQSGKPVFWYYFVKALYGRMHLVEVPIAVQLAFCAVVFARILSWCWQQGMKRVFVVLLVFVCLAPHMIFFMESLYPDGIFSVAIAGLLFELWLGVGSRKLSGASLAMIGATLPVAAFARPNGIVFLVAVIVAIFMVNRTSRIWLALITAVWCALIAVGAHLHNRPVHGSLYPLALFETVNFLQPRPMNLWTPEPRVSPKTVEVLSRFRRLANIIANYDPDYWDPLVHSMKGPGLMGLPEADKKVVVTEFFRYNLWHNIPRFVASRVNIFLASALAEGDMPKAESAWFVLEQTQTKSRFRKFGLAGLEKVLTAGYNASFAFRWLLWSPFFGIGLLGVLLWRGIKERRVSNLIVTVPMLLQLGGIFLFSIAAEYRYLLPLFCLPLVLLPMEVMSMRGAALQADPSRD